MFVFEKIKKIKILFKKIKILLIVFALLFPLCLKADILNQKVNFFVDKDYDFKKREKVEGTLFEISKYGYFYVETNWYQNLTEGEKKEVKENLKSLSKEFDQNIYTTLTSIFGKEWSPGIDNDKKITIFFHQMKKGVGGYFNNGDEYLKVENPRSNEREMVYLNAIYLKSEIIKSYLAHEFLHLITFNQKERLRGEKEEIWLNEARAEYAPTLLGYDKEYQKSNLKERVKQFIDNPNDSLIEWKDQKSDYGVINLFVQYLVEHYGIEILVDSLHSKKVGIPSINEALEKNGFKEDFNQIFTDWLIAVFLNNCNLGEKFCYKNENLKNIKVVPSLIFLPSTQKTEFYLNYSIKSWSGYWYRIFGGKGDLKLIFDGEDGEEFKVVFVLCKDEKKCEIHSLKLDEKERGEIFIEDFSEKWKTLTLIPSLHSLQSKISSFSLSIIVRPKTKEEKEREKLLARIENLKKKILEIQEKIKKLMEKRLPKIPPNFSFKRNLYYGSYLEDVIYLKRILFEEGCLSQVLFTKWFGPKTKKGVQCFCQKYKKDISRYAGYQVKCTGFVGRGTRKKLNEKIFKE